MFNVVVDCLSMLRLNPAFASTRDADAAPKCSSRNISYTLLAFRDILNPSEHIRLQSKRAHLGHCDGSFVCERKEISHWCGVQSSQRVSGSVSDPTLCLQFHVNFLIFFLIFACAPCSVQLFVGNIGLLAGNNQTKLDGTNNDI